MNNEHAETEALTIGYAVENPESPESPDVAVNDGESAAEAFHKTAPDEPFVPKPRYRPAKSTKILACAVLIMAGIFGGALVQKSLAPAQSGNRANVTQLRTGGQGGGTQSGTQGDTGTPTRGTRGGQGAGAGTGTGTGGPAGATSTAPAGP